MRFCFQVTLALSASVVTACGAAATNGGDGSNSGSTTGTNSSGSSSGTTSGSSGSGSGSSTGSSGATTGTASGTAGSTAGTASGTAGSAAGTAGASTGSTAGKSGGTTGTTGSATGTTSGATTGSATGTTGTTSGAATGTTTGTTGTTSGATSGATGTTSGSTAGTTSGSTAGTASGSTGNPNGLHAVGNQLFDGTQAVRLLGADRSGTEYACIQNDGIFDGPSDQASISAMLTWKINAIRIPLNEDCWLAINGAPAKYSGTAYQQAISAYVALLLQNGIYPILDLHWTAPGTTQATTQYPMPDMDHSVAFWTAVATAYAGQPKVIFDLFNEPYPDKNMEATAAWTCWRDGGTCANLVVQNTTAVISYPVAGMQTLVNAVRAAGANNFIILGGVEYSNDLTQWLTYKPTDSANNLGASWHVYDSNVCASAACYASEGGAVGAKVPIIASEIGAKTACDGSFITGIMDFLDAPGNGIPGQSYLAWAWNNNSSPSIISDYTGTPKCDGPTYQAHLAATPH